MMDTEARRRPLSALLDSNRCLRVLEAHSPISALLAQFRAQGRGQGVETA